MNLRMAARAGVGLVLLCLSAATCALPQEPALGSCGNRVVEANEDCDNDTYGGFLCGETGPGACHWQCLDGVCPSGFQCDADGKVCRAPSGTFEPVVSDLAALSADGASFRRVSTLLATDLDGVAPAELALQGGDRFEDGADVEDSLFVARFDRAGAVVSLRRERTGLKLNAPMSAAGRATEGTSEVVVAPHPRVPSVLTLRGQSADSGSTSLLPGLGANWGGLREGAVLTPGTRQNDQGTFGFSWILDGDRSAQANDSAAFGPLPGWVVESPLLTTLGAEIQASDLARHAAHGRLHEGDAAPFESLVLALHHADGDEVRIYPSFALDTFTTVELPFGKEVDPTGGVWLEKVDGDERLDLLLTTKDGDTYLAHGAGDGTFSSSSSLSPVDNAFEPAPFIFQAHPLAVGLIDGDQRADFVFSGAGVALSAGDGVGDLLTNCPEIHGGVAYVCGSHNGTVDPAGLPAWDSATLADLNDDGRLDIVATDSNAVDVFYSDYDPGGEALLLEHRLPTASRPRTVEVADVDGDLLGDIVYSVGADGVDSLFVAYGAAQGGPDAAVKVFEAEAIVDVKSVSNGRDLYVLSRDGGEELRWSYVPQRTDRALAAPLLLPCVEPLGQDGLVPQQLAAGHFLDATGDLVDAALLYEDCFPTVAAEKRDRLVLVPGTANGGLSPVLREPLDASVCTAGIPSCQAARRAFRPTSLELETPAGWSRDATLVAADLDADGADELILVGPDADGGRMLVLRSDGAAEPRFEVVSDAHLALPVGAPFNGARNLVQIADVDGDRLPDLVLLLADRRLAVVTNSGDPADPLPASRLVALTSSADSILAFALLDADADGVERDVLLVVGSPPTGDLPAKSEVLLEQIDAQGGAVVPFERGEFAIPQGESALDPTQIVAADFDGDNLTDFAVSDGTSVAVYRSVAKNP